MSRFHLAPSAWGSPSASVHSAVLSRDSSFFICEADTSSQSGGGVALAFPGLHGTAPRTSQDSHDGP